MHRICRLLTANPSNMICKLPLMQISIASHGQTLCAGEIANHQDSNLFALYLDDDISAGMAISGRLATGRNGLAANIGHISLPWPVAFELMTRYAGAAKQDV